MRITVAICTRNRSAQLRQTLEQLTNLVIPSDTQWELLVVNNNSTDTTDEVLAGFATRLPLRRLFEPKAGKSHALNLSVQEAKGEYILWTDDDVLVDSNWMTAYCAAFSRWPEAAVFGGPIEPLFDGTPPFWLQRVLPRVEAVYSRRKVGDTPAPIIPTHVPVGANLAIRHREQSLHLYDTRLGPQPNSAILAEDIVCVRSILASGATGWWVPQARVQHCIPESRQTLKYIRRHHSGYGEFLARRSPDCTSTRLLGKPRYLWRQAVQAEVRFRIRRMFRPPEVWIEDLITSSISWGALRGDGLPPIDIAVPMSAELQPPPGVSPAHSDSSTGPPAGKCGPR